MQLEMKSRCERCGKNLLPTQEAYICSYECTFCASCASHANRICSHCGGELVRRPRRIGPSSEQGISQPEAVTSERRWLISLVSLGIWGFIAIVGTVTITGFYRSTGRGIGFFDTLGLECSQILPYAPLTPFVFVFARRCPMRRKNWIRRSILYLLCGLVFSLAHVSIRAVTPYGYWEAKDRMWHSAVWDSQAHKISIRWRVLESLFLSNVVDDISGAYLPIVLAAYMISFYRSYRERERRTVQLEAQLIKANLQSLKAQLQPHFLFNTMHSISALMLTDVGAADKMMSRLSDLLRMSFEDGSGQITALSREFEFVTIYLDIEKVRLGDRLNIVLDFADDTLDAQVPHLLLQPLVENAIKHGVSRIASGGEIRVAASHEKETLHLLVRDNGPGLSNLDMAHSQTGLGLRATQERLRTLYGDNQRLEITNRQQGGVEVSVRIPFRPMLRESFEEL